MLVASGDRAPLEHSLELNSHANFWFYCVLLPNLMEPNHLIKFTKVWLLNSLSGYVACWGVVTTSILGNFPYAVMTTWKKRRNNNNNKQTNWFNDQNNKSGFFLFFLVHFIPSFLQCKWLTVICKTTWNETKWKSVLCKMKICFKKWWQKVAIWIPCRLDRKIGVTNGLCEHCNFFASTSRDKEFALRAVSASYIFRLQ